MRRKCTLKKKTIHILKNASVYPNNKRIQEFLINIKYFLVRNWAITSLDCITSTLLHTLKWIQITKSRVRVDDSTGLFVLSRYAYTFHCSAQNTVYLMYMEKPWFYTFVLPCSFSYLFAFWIFPLLKLTSLQVDDHFSVFHI